MGYGYGISGSGGGSGGIIYIKSRQIINFGIISVKGGKGSNGSNDNDKYGDFGHHQVDQVVMVEF